MFCFEVHLMVESFSYCSQKWKVWNFSRSTIKNTGHFLAGNDLAFTTRAKKPNESKYVCRKEQELLSVNGSSVQEHHVFPVELLELGG